MRIRAKPQLNMTSTSNFALEDLNYLAFIVLFLEALKHKQQRDQNQKKALNKITAGCINF